MRVKSSFPLIRGHSAAVTDLKFSPFVNNLLASASEDGTVKIWTIPENGLKEDMTGETQLFNGHTKKVSLLAFHPSVRDVIASVGSAQDLFVWNITNSEVLSKINLNEQAYNIDWNYLGSLAALMCKNKKLMFMMLDLILKFYRLMDMIQLKFRKLILQMTIICLVLDLVLRDIEKLNFMMLEILTHQYNHKKLIHYQVCFQIIMIGIQELLI